MSNFQTVVTRDLLTNEDVDTSVDALSPTEKKMLGLSKRRRNYTTLKERIRRAEIREAKNRASVEEYLTR